MGTSISTQCYTTCRPDPLPRNTVNQFTPGEVPSTGWQLSGLRTTNSLPTGANIEPDSVELAPCSVQRQRRIAAIASHWGCSFLAGRPCYLIVFFVCPPPFFFFFCRQCIGRRSSDTTVLVVGVLQGGVFMAVYNSLYNHVPSGARQVCAFPPNSTNKWRPNGRDGL